MAFFGALVLAAAEEYTALRKSKPMVLAAGIVWALVGWAAMAAGEEQGAEQALRAALLRYAELMLFLLVAMTFVEALNERRLFLYLRLRLGHLRLSYRQLYWSAGGAGLLLSPLLENITTVLLLGAMVVTLGATSRRFVGLACISLLVAVNAGGVVSPFGDLTTLILWREGISTAEGTLGLTDFLSLWPAAVVAWAVPALVMYGAVPRGHPPPCPGEPRLRRGAVPILFLFASTVAIAVLFRGLFGLPAAIGMMTGLGLLQFYGYYLRRTHRESADGKGRGFDIFHRIARAEWDGLLFLYGAAVGVAGLGHLGHLTWLADSTYGHFGAIGGNLVAGLASAFMENVPMALMVLEMRPEMSLEQWRLLAFVTGTGGSLLAIGSAASVALLGLARGRYTFATHLKWMPAILMGWILAIGVVML